MIATGAEQNLLDVGPEGEHVQEMGQFHEVMPALDDSPMVGKRVLEVIAVLLFHQKVRFDSLAMAPCAIAPDHDVLRRQRPSQHPGPVRLMPVFWRMNPRFVA